MYVYRTKRYVTTQQSDLPAAPFPMAPRSPPWQSKYSHLASASYLADLRNNRPARPVGSRPLPARPTATVHDENHPPRAGSAFSLRPLPENEQLPPARAESAMSFHQGSPTEEVKNKPPKPLHRASLPASTSYGSLGSQKGRPLVTIPSTHRRVSPPFGTPASEAKYRELANRQQERDEAHSLREALERIDHKDDEKRLHEAAKMEAADLVWKHQHPNKAEAEKVAAYRNPDLDKGQHERLTSAKVRSEAVQVKKDIVTGSRSASGGSASSTESKRPRLPWLKKRSKTVAFTPIPTESQTPTSASTTVLTSTSTPIPKPNEAPVSKGLRKTSGKRQTSSGSTKGIFRNPEDEIYEEKIESSEMPVIVESPIQQLPLQLKQRNSLPRGSRPFPEKSHTFPMPDRSGPHALAADKGTPIRPKDATSVPSDQSLPETPAHTRQDAGQEEEESDDEIVRYIDGYEVRSDEIRAATSMRKSDRSPNLPTPTAVSDRPGRPIVSFDKKWQPGSDSPRGSRDMERPSPFNKNDGSRAYPVKPTPPIPEIIIKEDPRSPALLKEKAAATTAATTVPVPSISISVDEPDTNVAPRTTSVPQITIAAENSTPIPPRQSRPLPQVTISADEPMEVQQKPKSRPLPAINTSASSSSSQAASRPLPQASGSVTTRTRPTQSEMASRVPWLTRTPTATTASTVTCTACTLPIAGRIVTASGSSARSAKARFHPECFTCHQCSEGLEAVAFYPEPEAARLERITSSLPELDPDGPQVQALMHSNQDARFFCHLDYHEFFSPRCHNCKTPIEGAVILALGRHYHADHFFCAECGDPFSSESPFVEHNDYPYCVSCHTKRTSARCRACRAPILNEMTVEALGGKWHDQCFVCCDCGGDFGEEGRFFVREVEVELTDKQRRKGMGPLVEERAACQACEERRLKNAHSFL